jgi:hypothetical protein
MSEIQFTVKNEPPLWREKWLGIKNLSEEAQPVLYRYL